MGRNGYQKRFLYLYCKVGRDSPSRYQASVKLWKQNAVLTDRETVMRPCKNKVTFSKMLDPLTGNEIY